MKYLNQKTNLQVIAGKIKSVADNRQSVTITTPVYDRASKKFVYQEMGISTTAPLTDAFKAGECITAVGYPNGPTSILANHIASGAKSSNYEVTDLAVVSGKLVYARLNEEKTQDGSANLKKDGTPKKPHFDIRIDVEEGDKVIHHTIKVYNIAESYLKPNQDGSKQQQPIEKMMAKFKNFEDAEKTPMYVTVVTSPGSERVWERESDGVTKIDYYNDHLGQKSVDLIPLFQREKEQTKTAEQTAPAKEAEAPAQPAQSQPAEFAQEVGGQESPVVDDGDVPFI